MKKRMWQCFPMALLLNVCLLMSCSVDDEGDNDSLRSQFAGVQVIYSGSGEWTVNQQVVDTARLEVTDVLKVRLPEYYLGASCFEQEYLSSSHSYRFEYLGQPAVMPYRVQGYSSNTVYCVLGATEISSSGTPHVNQPSFMVVIDGVTYRVDLFSEEQGNVIYRPDVGLWTIGLSVSSFLITNLSTNEIEVRVPRAPITLYYNTK